MLRAFLVAGLSVLGVVSVLGAAVAQDINKRSHLDPRMNSKVQTHIAKGWLQQGTQGGAGGQSNPGCGGQAVGNVQVNRGAQAPREVNTIITGDVINVVRPGAC